MSTATNFRDHFEVLSMSAMEYYQYLAEVITSGGARGSSEDLAIQLEREVATSATRYNTTYGRNLLEQYVPGYAQWESDNPPGALTRNIRFNRDNIRKYLDEVCGGTSAYEELAEMALIEYPDIPMDHHARFATRLEKRKANNIHVTIHYMHWYMLLQVRADIRSTKKQR